MNCQLHFLSSNILDSALFLQHSIGEKTHAVFKMSVRITERRALTETHDERVDGLIYSHNT